jgi:hypothetical protein
MEVNGRPHYQTALPPGKKHRYPFTLVGGWMDPRAGLDGVEKRKILTLPEIESRPSYP